MTSKCSWLTAQVLLLWVAVRNLVLRIIAQGHVPAHVAFIMDGNRRFARRSHVATIKGHAAGFGALEQILDWSMELGVKEVSVYAFSIENFKRPKEEVDGLMDLAEEKFHQMMQENKMIDKLGIRVKVIGDLDMIPEKTRIAIDKVVDYSKNNTKATLNVCFAYTARDEMAKAINTLSCTAHRARAHLSSSSSTQMSESELLNDEERLVRLIKGGEGALVAPPIDENGRDIYEYNGSEKEKLKRMGCESEKTRWGEEVREGDEGGWGWEDEMWRAMMIKTAPDLIVRTSGEIRLSDYMLWQTAFSTVVFLNVLWPDFSVWHFLYVILVYQYNYSTMKARRKCYADEYKNNNNTSKDPTEHPLLDNCDDTTMMMKMI